MARELSIVDMFDKKGGDLEVVVTRTEVVDQKGEPVVDMTSTVVIIERHKQR